MRKKELFRRLGAVLTVLAIAAFLWGCGQTAPTAVDLQEQSFAPAGQDDPDDGGDDGEGQNDGWW
jgi:hypothetical protein